MGIVVASGEGVHGIEAAESAGRNGSFGTTGDDGVRLAETNEVESIGDGVRRRSAGRSGGIVGTMESVHDRNLSGSDVGDHLGDEEGAESRTFLFLSQGVFADLFFEGMDTADAHSEYHADVVFVDRFEVQTAVLYSLHCRHDCILFIEIHFANLFAVNEICCLEVFHFAGKVRFEP